MMADADKNPNPGRPEAGRPAGSGGAGGGAQPAPHTTPEDTGPGNPRAASATGQPTENSAPLADTSEGKAASVGPDEHLPGEHDTGTGTVAEASVTGTVAEVGTGGGTELGGEDDKVNPDAKDAAKMADKTARAEDRAEKAADRVVVGGGRRAKASGITEIDQSDIQYHLAVAVTRGFLGNGEQMEAGRVIEIDNPRRRESMVGGRKVRLLTPQDQLFRDSKGRIWNDRSLAEKANADAADEEDE